MRCVEAVVSDASEDCVQLSLTVGEERFDVHFRASVPLFVERADVLVPLGLVVAMATRSPLVVHGPVSPLLLGNVARAQTILEPFTGGVLTRTEMSAEPASDLGSPGMGVGSFFSAGVDSAYTASKHQGAITHLVYVSFRPGSARDSAGQPAIRGMADAWGVELIEIETNVFEITDSFAGLRFTHGPVLATIALLLQSTVRQMFVPSGQAYRDLIPHCTHPLIDPLWSTEALEIVHDGCECTRVEKVALLATSDVALENLRVLQPAVFEPSTAESARNAFARW